MTHVDNLPKRLAAGAVDAVLALMLTGLVMTPLVALSAPQVWAQTNPIPLLWALIFVLMAVLRGGATPGKRLMKLAVHGSGCLICRELRRSGWALLLGVSALLYDALPFGVGDALNGGGLGLLLWSVVEPWLGKHNDFPHNRNTGFAVTLNAAIE